MSAESNVKNRNPFTAWLAWSNEDSRKTFIVAILLSLVCSLMVATSAVLLKPAQQANKQLEIQRNILKVANISGDFEQDEGITEQLFNQYIDVRLIDVASGRYIEHADPVSYDWRGALSDTNNSVAIPAQQDIAKIKRRPRVLPVYLVKQQGQVSRLILPVYGYGLWSTLYGFIALQPDTTTVAGLSFYEHAETPGLGGEVDNPDWQMKWQGKQIYDADNNVMLAAVRGHVRPDSDAAAYHVDGLSGASLTTRGVTHLVQYWLGDQGFGAYLKQFRANPQ